MCIRDSTHTHTHTHTHNSRYFWPHSCLFSYICTLFKWKAPKPTQTPVSYTHLDVYKRQNPYKPNNTGKAIRNNRQAMIL